MRLKAQRIVPYEEVEVEPRVIIEAFQKLVFQRLKCPPDAYIKGGRLRVSEDEWLGSHSWGREKDLREATGTDLQIIPSMETILKFLARS